jgi:hypothetical protein
MYEFSDEDLKFNKRGQLSPAQQEWLRGVGQRAVRMQGSTVWIAVGFLCLGLCLILGMYLSNESTRVALFSNPINLVIFPVLVCVIVGILVLSILLARWNANKLSNAVLSSVSGTVRFDQDYSSNSNLTTYYVIVGKKKFKFGDDMSGAFKEGEKYKLYYTKAGMYEFVMSYEKITP